MYMGDAFGLGLIFAGVACLIEPPPVIGSLTNETDNTLGPGFIVIGIVVILVLTLSWLSGAFD